MSRRQFRLGLGVGSPPGALPRPDGISFNFEIFQGGLHSYKAGTRSKQGLADVILRVEDGATTFSKAAVIETMSDPKGLGRDALQKGQQRRVADRRLGAAAAARRT